MNHYDQIAKACEAQRERNYPEPAADLDEIEYLTAQDILDGCDSAVDCGEMLRDCFTDDQAAQIFYQLRNADTAQIGWMVKHCLTERAQELADKTNRSREAGLAEFRANRAEWLEDR